MLGYVTKGDQLESSLQPAMLRRKSEIFRVRQKVYVGIRVCLQCVIN